MAKYNLSQIICDAKKCHREGVSRELTNAKKELEVTKLEQGFTQRKLKVHEDREKRRIEGLKKATAKRKSAKIPKKKASK